jgi:protease I
MQRRKLALAILLPFSAFILLAPLCLSLSMINEAIASEKKAQVLLIIRHGFSKDTELVLKKEVGLMTSMIEDAGFTVVVTSASGELIEGKTLKLKPNLKLADVKVNNYVGIIIPCMAKEGDWSEEEVSLVKEAVAQAKPIAAQRGAVVILAKAGELDGKYYTTASIWQFSDYFSGAIYSGKDVIKDGNIITSRHCSYAAKYYGGVDGTSELTKLFIAAIKD